MSSPSLDPGSPAEWQQLKEAFDGALQAAFTHVQDLDARPLWREAPEAIVAQFETPPPEEGVPLDWLTSTFAQQLVPYANGNLHPRFFGWVHGGGNLYGALGETCAALLNNNLGGRNHLAQHVERQVIRWSQGLFDFPAESAGLLTSGTSMATLIALTVARRQALGESVGTDGLPPEGPRLVGYVSAEGHHSAVKAFQILGLGSAALRRVPVTADHSLDSRALAQCIRDDRTAGRLPFCVIATIGTVGTGAIDDLDALATLCADEKLWLHVDAAFGAGLTLLPAYRARLQSAARADSVAFDFHKAFQVPYAVGCVLVRDAELHRATFAESRDYLAADPVGLASGAPWPCDFGPELSRGFLALKVWFTFQALGTRRLAAMVERQCALAAALGARISDHPRLVLGAPVASQVVCLQFVPEGLSAAGDADYLDALNRAIAVQLPIQGVAAPSTTRLDGRLVIRLAIMNHRTQQADLDTTVDQLVALGQRLHQRFGVLLQPTRWQLMRDGDARLKVNPQSGLNRYGCSPVPRDDAFTFASSTATSISQLAWHAAEQTHQRLLHACIAADDLAPLADHCRAIEQRIARILGFDALQADLHLASSGTDAQLLAMAAITTARPGQWVSLVCGSDETGSGTPASVTGCHFDAVTRLGRPVARGERLTGFAPIYFRGLPFRDAQGRDYDIQALDRMVEQAVIEAVDSGHFVALHVMDHSKLGNWAPSADLLDRLRQRYPTQVQVVVDACQLRLDAEDLREHLQQGDILLLTGSKFLTGPPFSGALVLPASLADRLKATERTLPEGLRDYLPAAELGSWSDKLPEASPRQEIGLLLRWEAALDEADRYFRVPPRERVKVLERFGKRLMAMIAEHPHVELLYSPGQERWARQDRRGTDLGRLRTIFPLLIRDISGQLLTPDYVEILYDWLNRDISDLKPWSAAQRTLAAQAIHLGRPVILPSRQTAVLRISAGARIVSEGWHNHRMHPEHLQQELQQARTALDKITLCIEHLHDLRGA